MTSYTLLSLLFLLKYTHCSSIANNGNNELITDRSLLRTMTIIEQRTEVGRLVLLICGKKKICQRYRSDIPQYIRDFNEENQYTGVDLIHYHFYVMGQPLSILTEQPQSFPALVYIIAKTPYVFYGNINDKSSIHTWLAEMDRLKVPSPSSYDEINEILANVDDENCTMKYMLMINDEKQCSFPTWSIIARHLSKEHGIVPLQISTPIRPEISVVLRKRLPEFSVSQCRNVALITHNSYAVPPDSQLPEVHSEWVKLHFPERQNCFSLDSTVWFPILPKLTELELIFFSGEHSLASLEHNWSYIWIGVVGGCAVCTLAFSIFWGLNGSAFAK